MRLACLSLVAVAAHCAVFGWLGRITARPPAGLETVVASGALRPLDIRQVFVPAAVGAGPAAEEPFSGSSATSKPVVGPVPTAPGRRVPSRHHRSQEPASIKEAIEAIETQTFAAHFYTFNEVELPAAPVSDWDLDATTLDNARIARLVFDMFVADDGTVIDCTIIEPAEMESSLRHLLESRLRSTALLPAVRAGRTVDSVRRIELFVS